MGLLTSGKGKKIIISILVVTILLNVIVPEPLIPKAHADFGGILLWPLTAVLSAIVGMFQLMLNASVWLATKLVSSNFTGLANGTDGQDVFIGNIVFNQIPLFRINIFDTSNTGNFMVSDGSGDASGIIGDIVKQWYGITRLIAISSLLIILLYIGIKISISSTGESKAKYKELLKTWLLSALLLFSLHFVMAAIMFTSDAITEFFATIAGTTSTFDYNKLKLQAFSIHAGIVWSLCWAAFLIYTLIFIIIYIKRLLFIAFYIVMGPLVVMVHTIEKLKGGSSGLLEKWMKEFIAQVVMQPMDAMIFAMIIGAISKCVDKGSPLIALAFVAAYLPIRKLVPELLGQESSKNSTDSAKRMGLGAAAAGAVALSSKVGKLADKKSGSGGMKLPSGGGKGGELGEGGNGSEGGSGGEGGPGGGPSGAAIPLEDDSSKTKQTDASSIAAQQDQQKITEATTEAGEKVDKANANSEEEEKTSSDSGGAKNGKEHKHLKRTGRLLKTLGKGLARGVVRANVGVAALAAGALTAAAGKGFGTGAKGIWAASKKGALGNVASGIGSAVGGAVANKGRQMKDLGQYIMTGENPDTAGKANRQEEAQQQLGKMFENEDFAAAAGDMYRENHQDNQELIDKFDLASPEEQNAMAAQDIYDRAGKERIDRFTEAQGEFGPAKLIQADVNRYMRKNKK